MAAAILVLATALAQSTQSFTFVVEASVADALPLFGPVGEARWAPGWAPRFIHPADADDRPQREGMVFTIAVGKERPREQMWILTEYDVGAGKVSYVAIDPNFMITEIKIRLTGADTKEASGAGRARCSATVLYRRSALDPAANAIVDSFDPGWAGLQGPHWAAAINAALAKRTRP